jgi:threonyl-tRNA synthetase
MKHPPTRHLPYQQELYKDGFSEGDLAKIEKNMNKLVKQNLKIERSEMSQKH